MEYRTHVFPITNIYEFLNEKLNDHNIYNNDYIHFMKKLKCILSLGHILESIIKAKYPLKVADPIKSMTLLRSKSNILLLFLLDRPRYFFQELYKEEKDKNLKPQICNEFKKNVRRMCFDK